MIQYFQVGVITQPHGIHGEVKVFPISDDIKRFDDLRECYLKIKKDMVPVTCTGVKYFKNLVILQFKEFESIDDVERLRQCPIYVDREHAVPLNEGEYYLADVLGIDVVTEEGKKVGILKDYFETAAQTVYQVITDDGKEVLIPAIDEFVKKVDIENNTMTVHLIKGMI